MTMIANLLQRELFTPKTSYSPTTPVRVIGVGDAGCRAATQVFGDRTANGNTTVFCIDTDSGSLDRSTCDRSLLLGPASFRGFGSGGDAAALRRATEDAAAIIKEMVAGAECVVIMAGASGITGSTAAPIVACMAREAGVLVAGIAFMPFEFERSSAHQHAEDAIAALRSTCDGVLEVPAEATGTGASLAASLDQDRRYAGGFVRLLDSIFRRSRLSTYHPNSSGLRSVLSDGRRLVYASECTTGTSTAAMALSNCVHEITARGADPAQLGRALILVESTSDISTGLVAELTATLESIAGSNVQVAVRHARKPMLPGQVRVSLIGAIRESRRRLVFDELHNRLAELKSPGRVAVFI